MSEKRTSKATTRAVPAIVEALGAWGVTGVHWFLAFHGQPILWLVTRTDAEKAAVAERGCFRDVVCQQLAAAGVAQELAARASVTVESEETVARHFDGNWWYAMK